MVRPSVLMLEPAPICSFRLPGGQGGRFAQSHVTTALGTALHGEDHGHFTTRVRDPSRTPHPRALANAPPSAPVDKHPLSLYNERRILS